MQGTESDVEELNSLLKGEIAATETYRQVMEKADSPEVGQVLAEGHRSHQRRVRLLTDRVRDLGGIPLGQSGVWGAFTQAVQGGAKLFGVTAAVSVLEEGEDHGNREYEQKAPKLSPTCEAFVRTELIPEQKQSHDALARLKKSL